MRGLQEVFVRPKRRPREPGPDGASRLSPVRQFERKEEMKAYPSDSERLRQSTNLTQTLAGLNGDIGKCVRSSRETRDSSAFPMSDRRQSARMAAVDAIMVGSRGTQQRCHACQVRGPSRGGRDWAGKLPITPDNALRQPTARRLGKSLSGLAFITGQCFFEVVSWKKHSRSNG